MSAPDQPHILEDRVVGRGSSDMKGGLAAMLYTLVHMKQRGLKPGCNILFLATCDEEHGGAGANYFRQQFDMSKVHHLLISEPTDCRLGIAQKGCLWLDVEIHGSTSHGAYPEKGVNALEAGMRLYQHLKKVFEQDQHLLLGHSTVTLTRMNGGIAANMVPDSCTLSMDIRLTPAYSGEQVCAEMEAFVQNVLRANGTAIEVSWEIVNNRMAIGLPASHGLYRQYQGVCDAVCDAICDSVSDTQQPIGVRYFTDASLLIASHPNIPVILYGPGRAAQAHQPNESLYWSDFKTALTFYEIVYQMSFE
jgi:succinyl-diaminopimelate desuccinylase